MFALGIIITIIILITKILISNDLGYFIDITTLTVIIGFNISLLFATGSFKDFRSALTIIFKKDKKSSNNEIKKGIFVFDLMIKVTMISGFICAIIDFITIMHALTDTTTIGSYMSLVSLDFLYSLCIICFFLLPAKFVLEKKHRLNNYNIK
ncbi:hypothetical protein SH1V18_19740 [Vallitalea longa]|uniref:Uncharacterized protein n=1 Tax=Vallitalea longa TaxID=2936439 RepID=A0A9W6DG89_9FIRM|nr:hypothetical protein [Vallitalea longa]GKX29494.1 hypothetical protein SH1V18_19740 [Vallitalea longa]